MPRHYATVVLALLGLSVAATLVVAQTETETEAQRFGYTTSTDTKQWIIHSGSGLTVTMVRATCDIVSLQYNSQELQYNAKGTHVNSGLGSNTTSAIATLPGLAKTIQVTCDTTGLTQYYLFREKENAVYMGTYHAPDRVLPELRFLARLNRATVTNGVAEATLDDTVGAIEAHDVYAAADNTTRSKFYSGIPFMHDRIHGVRGPKAGVYFVLSAHAYETSSGGPFFRDINNQCTTANELTFYMNSDHTRTEAYRYGFHGPYALVFTNGSTPASPAAVTNFSFFQDLTLKGFVAMTERGRVTGTITDSTGLLRTSPVVVGFSNAAAQYWTTLAAGTTAFASPHMKPGVYNTTVYKKQLPVGTGSVTVVAGKSTIQDLAVSFTENANKTLWQIGEWDGTPDGFLNADKIHTMHPSDTRMHAWVPLLFNAEEDEDAAFPLALFRGVNDPLTLAFRLSTSEAAAPRRLKIGVSLAQVSGRPSVQVNDQWTAPTLATAAVKTRGVTRGVTTGTYMLYEVEIPATALVVGENKVTLGITSGATDAVEPFLHASVVFDALQLE